MASKTKGNGQPMRDRRYRANNKEKIAARAREWWYRNHEENKRTARERRKLARQVDPMRQRAHVWKQRGCAAPTRGMPETCECCGRAATLCLDHCHVSGAFRGWLCHLCNTGIGKLGDDIAGLKRAISYLEKA